MARPITWQDVVAPKQGQNLLAAQQATKMITEGLGQSVDALGDLRDSTKQAATDQAAAFVMNAQDPLAAVQEVAKSAAPFNPLDIAKVANTRTTQIQDAKVADATLRAQNIQAEVAQASLDDRVAEREAAVMAEDGLQYIQKTGQMPTFEKDDPRASTAAGLLTQKIWREEFDRYNKNKRAEEELSLQRITAKLAQKDRAEAKALEAALGETTRFFGSPEGAALVGDANVGERDRRITEIFDKYGANLAYMSEGRSAASMGLSGSKASQTQLAEVKDSTTGASGLDLQAKVQRDARSAELTLNQWKADHAVQLRVAQLDATNPYEKLDDTTAANKFLSENPELKTGWGPNWGTEDAQQRVSTIMDYAKDNGKKLTRAQAWMLLGQTKGVFTPFDTWKADIVTDDIKTDIDHFDLLAREGGWAQMQAREAAQQSEYDKAVAKAQRDQALIDSGARSGQYDKSLIEGYKRDPTVALNAANAEVTLLANQLAELNRTPGIPAATIQSVVTQLQKAQRKLAQLAPKK